MPQHLGLQPAPMGVPGLQGPYASAGGGGATQRPQPGWTAALQQSLASRRMSPEQKAYANANKEDRAIIEALIELWPDLAEVYREKEEKKVRDRIAPISQPYLNMLLSRIQGGEAQAPPLGVDTWRIAGKPAPAAAGGQLQQAVGGTTPGQQWQLALSQLEPGRRAEEFGRRVPPIEARFPGAGDVGRSMFDVTTPATMDERQRDIGRARQGPDWQTLQGIMKGWPGQKMTIFQQEKMIDDALESGQIDERTAKGGKRFVRMEQPSWVYKIPKEKLSDYGFVEDEDGKRRTQFSTTIPIFKQQERMQEVWSVQEPTLSEAHKIASADKKIYIVVSGDKELSQKQIKAIDAGESEFPEWVLVFRDAPVSTQKWVGNFTDLTKTLLEHFSPEEVQAIIVLATDKMIKEGRSIVW